MEPVASAASEGAERRARRRTSSAQPRLSRGHWLDNAPFGAPLPCFKRVILSENRNSTFRDHACGSESSWLGGWQSSDASASRERILLPVILRRDPRLDRGEPRRTTARALQLASFEARRQRCRAPQDDESSASRERVFITSLPAKGAKRRLRVKRSGNPCGAAGRKRFAARFWFAGRQHGPPGHGASRRQCRGTPARW